MTFGRKMKHRLWSWWCKINEEDDEMTVIVMIVMIVINSTMIAVLMKNKIKVTFLDEMFIKMNISSRKKYQQRETSGFLCGGNDDD
jgi:hypothetical protein